jgi:hypothetical protein
MKKLPKITKITAAAKIYHLPVPLAMKKLPKITKITAAAKIYHLPVPLPLRLRLLLNLVIVISNLKFPPH